MNRGGLCPAPVQPQVEHEDMKSAVHGIPRVAHGSPLYPSVVKG